MKFCKNCKQTFPLDKFVSKNKERVYCEGCRKLRTAAVIKCRTIKQQRVHDYKRERGCVVCGFNEPIALDFHHRDPSVKDSTVAELFVNNATLERVFEEIDKCVLLCANHHRMFHAGLITI